ncbi:hypothetical protein Pfo_022149 [Paulownia fortunei]|nr:hypothetical protein Pfo_022149 [Paulownia fortunei]
MDLEMLSGQKVNLKPPLLPQSTTEQLAAAARPSTVSSENLSKNSQLQPPWTLSKSTQPPLLQRLIGSLRRSQPAVFLRRHDCSSQPSPPQTACPSLHRSRGLLLAVVEGWRLWWRRNLGLLRGSGRAARPGSPAFSYVVHEWNSSRFFF